MSSVQTPPPLIAPPNSKAVELPIMIASGRSLGSMRIGLFKRDDGECVGFAWFGEGAQGPPGNVHGGAAAYVLDEAMGSVGWMNDYPVVARKIDFEFLKMTPLFVDFKIEARVLRATDKNVYVEAALVSTDGTVMVKAHGEFAILTQKKIAALDAGKYDPKGLLQNPKLKWAKDEPR